MILKVKSFSDIDIKKFNEKINKQGFIIIRGLFRRNEIRKQLKVLKKNFNSKRDKPSSSGNHTEVMNNFQKVIIGSSSKIKENREIYRFHRIIYNPIWSKDIYGLRSTFKKFCEIRNYLMGHPNEFAIDSIEKGFWSATRISQFPAGGGHMSVHRDKFLNNLNKKNQMKFYQFILNMTEFGKDFVSGGAYIKKNKKDIFLEKHMNSGDLLIYNGLIEHGVKEIDTNKRVDISKLNGRIVLMNSLYKTKVKNM